MVIGLSGVQFGLNHTSDYQNQTTTKWESDMLIMSMIADRIQWHEVLLPINHKHDNFRKNKNTSTSTSKVNTSSILEILQILGINGCCYGYCDQICDWWI